MKPARVTLALALIPVAAWTIFVWRAYAIDVSPAGRLDRSGHIKGHDFVHFYMLGQIALDHASADLYDFDAQARRTDRLVPEYEDRFLPVHGPQVALFFAPLSFLPYVAAFAAWMVVTAVGYGLCCFWLFRSQPALRPFALMLPLLVVGYPAFYFLIANGQTTVIALACVTGAFAALRSRRRWLAGFALGCLVYKPSLGLVLPFVLVYGREWRMMAGAVSAVAAQFVLGGLFFGWESVQGYWHVATRLGASADLLEPHPEQMHSLRSFFSLLLPWPNVAMVAYVTTALVILLLAARCWSSQKRLEVRFAVLLLATILCDPHVNWYDLIVLAPALILTASAWVDAKDSRPKIWLLLYACYLLPALSPLTLVTHLQVSVIALALLTVALCWHRSHTQASN